MDIQNNISITAFCEHYGLTPAFVSTLGENGLIEIIETAGEYHIPSAHIGRAEQIIRLYLDLQVNTEGIEVILNLLSRIDDMHEEITVLKNRLRLYDQE